MVGWVKGRLVPLLQRTVAQWNEHNGSVLAASVAYYAAFSVFPLLLVALALLGYFLQFTQSGQSAQEQLLFLVAQNSSPALAFQVGDILAAVKQNAGLGGQLGLLGVLFGAMGIFGALDSALDQLWEVPPAVGGWRTTVIVFLRQRLNAFLMLLGTGLLLVLAFIAGLAFAGLSAIAQQVPLVKLGWRVADILFTSVMDILAFAVLYKVLPKPFVHWRDVWLGAILAGIVWELGRLVLSTLIIGTNYSAYGAVGAFIALMAWIYYAATVFMMGAVLVRVTCQASDEAAKARAGRPAQDARAGAHEPDTKVKAT